MRERDGFLLVYSVTDRGTFDSLLSFYEQLSAMHEEAMPPIVLVGNKSQSTVNNAARHLSQQTSRSTLIAHTLLHSSSLLLLVRRLVLEASGEVE